MLNIASDLVPQVLMSLKGCTEETAMYGLRRAFARLCRETGCWRGSVSFTVSSVEEDGHQRIVVVPDSAMKVDASISKILRVQLMKAKAGGGYHPARTLPPARYIMRWQGDYPELVFGLGVDVEDGDQIGIDLELFPPETGTTLTDIPLAVLHQCAEAAAPLAASMLAKMPGRPWSDTPAAVDLDADYRRAKRILLFRLENGATDQRAGTYMEPPVEG